jgi:hypothetical protein
MRMPGWFFLQLEDNNDLKREREEGFKRGFLQVHERECKIQLPLLSHSGILSHD